MEAIRDPEDKDAPGITFEVVMYPVDESPPCHLSVDWHIQAVTPDDILLARHEDDESADRRGYSRTMRRFRIGDGPAENAPRSGFGLNKK